MVSDHDVDKTARMPEEAGLPTRGGLYWFMDGVGTADLPEPCAWCVHFLAQLTDDEVSRLVRRAREQANSGSPNTNPSE